MLLVPLDIAFRAFKRGDQFPRQVLVGAGGDIIDQPANPMVGKVLPDGPFGMVVTP